MNIIRCPLCNEVNPGDAEKCRYCGFNLIADDQDQNQGQDQDDNFARLDDLFNNLGGVSDGTVSPEPNDAGGQPARTDWLSGLRSQAAGTREFRENDRVNFEGSYNPPGSDNHDWLVESFPSDETGAGILDEEDHLVPGVFPAREDSQSEPEKTEEAGILDWLDKIDRKGQTALFEQNIAEMFSEQASVESGIKPDFVAENPYDDTKDVAHTSITPSLQDEGESWALQGEDTKERPIEFAANPQEAEFFRGSHQSKEKPEDFPDFTIEIPEDDQDQPFSPEDFEWYVEETGKVIPEIDSRSLEYRSNRDIPNNEALSPMQDRLDDLDEGKKTISASDAEVPDHPAIPDWLKKMSPLSGFNDSGRQNVDSAPFVEKAGPIAGLVNALPAEPDIVLSSKPSFVSRNLQPTDLQKVHSRLLETLIGDEKTPKTPDRPPETEKHSVMKIVIALFLFGAALFSSLTNWVPLQPAASVGADAYLAKTLIDGLPERSPVLIAVEYSPGYMAELGPQVSLLFKNLIQSGHTPVFVTTSPLGPVLAEQIANNNQNESKSAQTQNYVNLGYLPGGAAGIRSFANNPPAIIQVDVHQKPVWGRQELKDIRTAAGFPLVIIATENPERFREWIEQMKPVFDGSRLLVVASAQNEVIVRAYLENAIRNKTAGLLSGSAGSSAYALLAGDPSQISDIWLPQAHVATTSLVVTLLLLAVQQIMIFRRKRTGREASN